jgi:hypothetical protein
MKSGCRSCALAAASSSALGINRRKITHTSTSIWAMPGRSAAPIALHYSVSIRAWAQTKPIRQIVLTLTWTELKSSNAASLVMLPADNQRQAPLSRSLGAVHDWPRTIRIRQDASLKTAEPTIAVARPRGPAPHNSDRNILMESLRLASSDRLPNRVIRDGCAQDNGSAYVRRRAQDRTWAWASNGRHIHYRQKITREAATRGLRIRPSLRLRRNLPA